MQENLKGGHLSKLKCGVAGLKRGGKIAVLLAARDDCDLSAVCATSQESLAEWTAQSQYLDFDTFLNEDLDVVVIATPGPLHAAQSIQALRSGAHVLCETPCVYSEAEAIQVAAAVRETYRAYMLAENYLWMSWFSRLQAMVGDGLLGDIIYAEGDYTHDCRDLMLVENGLYIPFVNRRDHPEARLSWRATSLPPLIYASHTLGPLLSLMDDRATAVVGMGTGSRTVLDLDVVDVEACLLETEKGAVVRLTNGFVTAHPMAFHYKTIGTKGSAIVQRTDETILISYSDKTGGSGWQKETIQFDDPSAGRKSTSVMLTALLIRHKNCNKNSYYTHGTNL